MKNNHILSLALEIILGYFPKAQAVYVFGSYGAEAQHAESDLDVAVLLNPIAVKKIDPRKWIDISLKIVKATGIEKVDLINLRQASTVFKKEVIQTGRRIYCADEYAAEEFEMITASLYQKLNEERREILQAFYESGKAYDV